MFQQIRDAYGRLLRVCGLIAGLIAFATMALVVANALMRKLFNRPLEGTLEIVEAMLPLLIFLAIAFTQLNKGHIRVILLTRHLPDAVQHWLHVATLLIGCAFFVWAFWASWGHAMESWEIAENAWGAIRFPIWPVKFAVSIGIALLAIQFLLDAIEELRADRREDGGDAA
jgi:TRAP-type C4-dicarboxylate transport system permease small subunit